MDIYRAHQLIANAPLSNELRLLAEKLLSNIYMNTLSLQEEELLFSILDMHASQIEHLAELNPYIAQALDSAFDQDEAYLKNAPPKNLFQ